MKNPTNKIWLVVCATLFVACGNNEQTVEEEPIKPVRYGLVELVGGQQTRTFNGTSQSGAEVNLSFRTTGLLTELNVRVGQSVRQGQLLARLDQRDAILNFEQAQASVQSAQIQMETDKASLDRIKGLYQVNSASLNDYENAKNKYAGSLSNLETAKKTLDLQESQLSYTEIIAPSSGIVSDVSVEVNEVVQAGSPIIVINSDQSDIEVNVGIPELYINDVESGQQVNISFNSIQGEIFQGVVTEVGFSTAGSATYPVTVKMTNPSSRVRPEMPAEVAFAFGDEDEDRRLVVPVKAVGDDFQGNYVYTLTPAENEVYEVQRVDVELNYLSDYGFVIETGLEEGQIVATAGLRTLFDGRQVTLLETVIGN